MMCTWIAKLIDTNETGREELPQDLRWLEVFRQRIDPVLTTPQ